MSRIFLSFLAIIIAASITAPPAAAQAATAVRAGVAYGAGFSIEYREGYKLLTVARPWPGATKGFVYALYPRGSTKPTGVRADRFFETPIRKAVTFSTTYIPQIAVIGEADSIVGVDTAAFVSTSAVRANIKAGKTVETTRNWAPDVERIIALAPDVVFTYGMGNEWDSHPKLVEAGLPVVIDAEWNEAEPLARAEWIKFVAAFYDKEAQAQAYFDKVAAEYTRLKSLAAGAAKRPAVLVNGPFQGTWAVSGGASYMARFISDAGGAYLWADDKGTGGIVLSIEAVFERGLRADVWLNPNLAALRVADVVALDSRFAALPVTASGAIWNNNLRMNGEGGNDYFESAVLDADKVLADMIKIFHPELLADRPFTYYRKLAK
ncbi:MAG: ABC transporter substrate-binding protein [Spirochaetaceae bacterium]|nr:ABC transporter substrate-binding protein [Spirochaetaceae bacterium]